MAFGAYFKHPFSAVHIRIAVPPIPLLPQQILNVGITEQPEMIKVNADIKAIRTVDPQTSVHMSEQRQAVICVIDRPVRKKEPLTVYRNVIVLLNIVEFECRFIKTELAELIEIAVKKLSITRSSLFPVMRIMCARISDDTASPLM